MFVSYKWLATLVDLKDISPRELAQKLTLAGIEVEDVLEKDVQGVVVGKIVDVKKHENASRLNICLVDVGGPKPLQIVCGASNVAIGKKVPVALNGAKLPVGKIKETLIRGVRSYGMICSSQELGLSKINDGIMILPEQFLVGEDVRGLLDLDDTILKISLTPNRFDCFSMLGLALEVAAILNRKTSFLDEDLVSLNKVAASNLNINIEHAEDCFIYQYFIFTDINITRSPQWLENRLILSGIKPINNIVDIANYIMLETGQPLHVFDYEKLKCTSNELKSLDVRRGRNEVLVALDGKEYLCDEDVLVIATKEKPVALAGILGGKETAVDEKTTSIFLECAYFSREVINKSSKKLNLTTEASLRFSKGINALNSFWAKKRIRALFENLCNAKFEETGLNVFKDFCPKIISFAKTKVNNYLGTSLKEGAINEILKQLNFKVTSCKDFFNVTVPLRRQDLNLDVDIIEEIARIYGYDRILKKPLFLSKDNIKKLDEGKKLERKIARLFCAFGFNEVRTYSLTSREKNEEIFSLNEEKDFLAVLFPLNNERVVLRSNLLTSFLDVLKLNFNNKVKDIAIFEIGKTYFKEKDKELPVETKEIAGLVVDKGFFYVKGVLEAIFKKLGILNYEFDFCTAKGLHPGRKKIKLII